ncbi:MAG TPA: peptidylprolyl isomerase [Dongiaceae bacterium]|nr:peptidylprolyl isomerase [Dongiaceae bacterium]
MRIANDYVVAFHYVLKNQQGEELDSSRGQLPLLYLHGHGHLLPGLEQALEGRESGDKCVVTLTPEQAYGVHDAELVQQLPRDAFGAGAAIELGMQLQAHTEDGEIPVRVIAMDSDSLTVDGNHPLAGQTLIFEVEIRNVREALPEELEEGEVDA